MIKIYTVKSSLGRQNMAPGEFSQECCPSPPSPREMSLEFNFRHKCSCKCEEAWRREKGYQLNKSNKNKIKPTCSLYLSCNGSFIHVNLFLDSQYLEQPLKCFVKKTVYRSFFSTSFLFHFRKSILEFFEEIFKKYFRMNSILKKKLASTNR